MKTLESKYIINGEIVNKSTYTLDKYDVYETITTGDITDLTLYFVDRGTGECNHVLSVGADMGQGVGYISDWSLEEI